MQWKQIETEREMVSVAESLRVFILKNNIKVDYNLYKLI